MGLMDRFKKVAGPQDGYDENYEDDYYDGFNGGSDEYDDVDAGNDQFEQTPAANAQGQQNSYAAPQPQNSGISVSGSNIKMQVVRPKDYDSETTSQIANHLLNKSTVVLNLENTNKETSRRLIDFLSGVAYSIGGSIKKIAANAYVITPSNVDVGEAPFKRRQPEQPQPQPEAKPETEENFTDFN